jgi:hypothetical protein
MVLADAPELCDASIDANSTPIAVLDFPFGTHIAFNATPKTAVTSSRKFLER